MPSWINKVSIKKDSIKKEDKFLKTINSGALSFDKGDFKSKDYMIEYKYTDKNSYILKLDDLLKNINNAKAAGKSALFVINFGEKHIFKIQEEK